MKRSIAVFVGDGERPLGTLLYDSQGNRVEALWRRIVFSILVTNVDDHLHNHGFLHAERGQWHLSPPFDINPFPERTRERKTWISEDSGPEASIAAAMAVVPCFRMTVPRAKQALKHVERTVAGWSEEGKGLGMADVDLEQFRDAARRLPRVPLLLNPEIARGPIHDEDTHHRPALHRRHGRGLQQRIRRFRRHRDVTAG